MPTLLYGIYNELLA